ncbi:Sugar phosphate isomerase/epimerase [Rhodospirillales bacterium URHD0017]|nr:Sugar phosphate isomerase/epimerase [Rhodospirillales bacterium URHD0017]
MPALAGLAVPRDLLAQPRPSWRPGLQLYTVRDALGVDVDGTLKIVANTGYREVELAGLPGVTARAMSATLKRHGLEAPSIHASYDRLRRDFDAVLEEARILEATYVVCPSVGAEEWKTADDWKRVCQTLTRIGQVVRSHGLVLAYHNHDFEFVPFGDGATPFHLLMRETDPHDVKLELDVYWVAKAGPDPVQYLEDGRDRILLVHLKDLASDGATVEVGRGVLDFGRIVRTALLAGVKHLFVEQDTSADPLASIGASLQFLEQLPADVRPQSKP